MRGLSARRRESGGCMASRFVVEHLNHLGIVAEACREAGVAEWRTG
jgi:hypothetical protein